MNYFSNAFRNVFIVLFQKGLLTNVLVETFRRIMFGIMAMKIFGTIKIFEEFSCILKIID